ncbi:hypothetical protein Athai_57430 [Actinocatenispora thailandica]|uniref:Uncharacterized protein n=1 Tax=Actinocatenispora thailandica TaxID=227318 RepID=A0A7R7DV13_9ACTN|nr:hypothetical protein [Actinocatenispora thailandica]BCJ38240.1 hypothetical protein Athai_57430 [Actinocatenispora thailandica]
MGHGTHPVVRYSTPHAGDQVFISPAAGVHGHGSFWAMVVTATPALVQGAMYLRVVPVDDIGGDPTVRTFYVRLAGLLTRSLS